MSLFPSLPQNPHLSDVFRTFPQHVKPLLEYHDVLLRAESPLSVAERELLAAFVSGLNACTFCFGAHKLYANAFGIADDVIEGLLVDIDEAPIDEKLKPILHYVKKLNQLPARLTAADAEAVYAAGWDERALYDAIQVCALFNLMNRIIEGVGVSFDYAANPPTAEQQEKRKTANYVDFADEIGIELD
ncbi:carboxymuconolactone decarboxylase family protein [Marinicella sp. W31]|uniref:carboxymuconolactone decarboxylase family protein n=1 Tax=Marinicella sp. W31 TaxID=3023713 RepID=UPI003756D2A9